MTDTHASTSTLAARKDYRVADLSMAPFGRKEMILAEHEMPGLMALRKEYGDVEAARRRPHLRLAAHDHPDRGADRDAHRARRRGALGELQHLLHPGPRRRRRRRRPERHRGRPAGRPRVRLEGRDARGVLVVHRPDDDVARCGRRHEVRRPEHDPRRRRRRHDAAAQGRRVRSGRRGARPDRCVEPRVRDRARPAPALAEVRSRQVDPHGRSTSRASPRRRRPASSASTR